MNTRSSLFAILLSLMIPVGCARSPVKTAVEVKTSSDCLTFIVIRPEDLFSNEQASLGRQIVLPPTLDDYEDGNDTAISYHDLGVAHVWVEGGLLHADAHLVGKAGACSVCTKSGFAKKLGQWDGEN